jgi:hypothetical protein
MFHFLQMRCLKNLLFSKCQYMITLMKGERSTVVRIS